MAPKALGCRLRRQFDGGEQNLLGVLSWNYHPLAHTQTAATILLPSFSHHKLHLCNSSPLNI